MTETIETLRAAMRDAQNALKLRMGSVHKESIAAQAAVHATHAADLRTLTENLAAKRAAYDAAVSAAASHPWEGKRVFKDENQRLPMWATKPSTRRVFGWLFVRRAGETPGAANQQYGLPEVGEAYIVAAKKDGTPGARVISRAAERAFAEWKLADLENAK